MAILPPASFKHAYKKEFIPPKPGYFGIPDKFGIRPLTKICVDCSDLRDHRFNHGFANCPYPLCLCDSGNETSEHFLTLSPVHHPQGHHAEHHLPHFA